VPVRGVGVGPPSCDFTGLGFTSCGKSLK
jgi:hypothetical protein